MATLSFKEYRKFNTDKGNFLIPVFLSSGNRSDGQATSIDMSGALHTTILSYHDEQNIDRTFSNTTGTCLTFTDSPTGYQFQVYSYSDRGSMVYQLRNGSTTIGQYSSYYNTSTTALAITFPIIITSADGSSWTATIQVNRGEGGAFLGGEFGVKEPAIDKLGYLTIDDLHFGWALNSLNINTYPFVSSDVINTFVNTGEEYEISTDPYDAAGTSSTGGGDGTFDGTSDPVDIPVLPTVGATDAGFITLFAPTESQLKSLAEYMWSSAFDIEGGGTALAFKKLFNDPMECILGLSVVPVSVPTSGAREITVGNIVTTVQMNVASQQYIEVDCGSISFANKYFGSYLDYEPYTKMAIFVPYSGVHTISADDVMGKTVSLKYHIDILTGSLVAFLKCGNSVLYEFNGACASNIPVNSLNYASTIENAIRIAVNIGTTVATAGAAAPATGALTGKVVAQGVALAGSTAEGAISMKPSIDRAGSLGGTTGLMGNQIPYIIITRPRLCLPTKQNEYKGYPSFIKTTLSKLDGQGYTEFDTVVLDNLYLTDSEKEELQNILYGGVYL